MPRRWGTNVGVCWGLLQPPMPECQPESEGCNGALLGKLGPGEL
jgi:hypothetical protein